MNTSFGYKCGESRLVILWVSRPACRGDNTCRRKKLQSAPDFCPSPVVIMRNHSYFLIWVGVQVPCYDSRPVGRGSERARLGTTTLQSRTRTLMSSLSCATPRRSRQVEVSETDRPQCWYPFNGIMPFHLQITLSTPHEPPPRVHPEFHGIPHSTIARICLNFPNSQQVKSSPNRSRPRSPARTLSRSPTHPSRPPTQFLKYSSLYWGIHTRPDLSDCAKLPSLKLFDDCDALYPLKSS